MQQATHKPLRVLVTESEHGAADAAVWELENAGHEIHRCRVRGEEAFPCPALDDWRACPIESSAISAVLAVRSVARTHPTPLEDGVSCAIRNHIPLVVSGQILLNPFADYAARIVERDGDVVTAVEEAAASDLKRHVDAATSAINAVLMRRGHGDARGAASVKRQDSQLKVTLAVPAEADQATRDMAAVRAVQAIRAIDITTRGIDVSVTDLTD